MIKRKRNRNLKKSLTPYFKFLGVILILIILVEVLLVVKKYDFLYFVGILLWCLLLYIKRISSRISGAIALGMILIIPSLVVYGSDRIADKIAIWAYLFLNVSVIQLLIRYAKKNKN